MSFSSEQQLAYDKYVMGKNIFITGPGGSGKSYLIQKIVEHAKLQEKNYSICAMTGCAAILLNCGAKTLHSWSGIGLGKGNESDIITRINLNKYKREKWKKTELLIVDEVSMMSMYLFNLLNMIGQRVRKNPRPFGGIQLVFCGDFYQLPPIGNVGNPESTCFCFESPFWRLTFSDQIQLKKVFRQSDEDFSKILNQIRQGKLFKSGYNKLCECVKKKIDNESSVKPTFLFPTKRQVEFINKENMKKLDTEERKFGYKIAQNLQNFEGNDMNKRPTDEQKNMEIKYILQNSLFDEEVTLKVGSQVMCIANIDMDNGICNGSQGVITEFTSDPETGDCLPTVEFLNGVKMKIPYKTWISERVAGVGVMQIPLILSWAVTIHKSQGATLDLVQIDAGSDIFECGQTYVALSRVKTLDGLYLTSFNPQKIKVNKKVKEYYKSLDE